MAKVEWQHKMARASDGRVYAMRYRIEYMDTGERQVPHATCWVLDNDGCWRKIRENETLPDDCLFDLVDNNLTSPALMGKCGD